MIQMNVMNAFMNCMLNEMIYMRQSLNFETENTVFWLRKMLYELRQFFLLWQKKLISTFRNLEFKEISQKLYIMINEKVIIFFYVDDIVICYRKKNKTKVRAATSELQTKYTMNILRSLKWFLEIHVLQDRVKKLFWLLQETYINKLTNQFVIDVTDRLSETSMTEKLFLYEEKVTNVSTHTY